jgi:hypothetical protein
MRDTTKKRWSEGWISIAMWGAVLVILILPFLAFYDVRQKGYDLRGHEPESWMGLAHGGYILFALLSLVGVVAAVRGKVASDELSGGKKRMTNAFAGAICFAYAFPLLLFLVRVEGYIWVVARSLWAFISDAL